MQSIHQQWILPTLAAVTLLRSAAAQAQVSADGTTGTVVTSSAPLEFTITGGTTSGLNLFHSFDQFSIPSSGTITFVNNNTAIENVLGRVTGADPSTIDGLITAAGASPNFNLFLLNPNGIIFGPDGELNIGGSFVASTGSGIEFGVQGIFGAVPATSTDPNLLTVAPSALLFSQIGAVQPPRSIEVVGSFLSVPAGESLVLLGGNAAPTATAAGGVMIDGAVLDAQSGRVEIGAVGGEGRVALGTDFELMFPLEIAKADIGLQGFAVVDVGDRFGGTGGGTAQIQGRTVTLTDSALVAFNTVGLRGGGGITVRAEQLHLDNATVLTLTDSAATGGHILLDIDQGLGRLVLQNDSRLSAETEGLGAGGGVALYARDIQVLSSSGIGTETRGEGDAGAVTLSGQTLRLENGSILGNTFGQGNGGQISIDVADQIDLLGFSEIAANSDDIFAPGGGIGAAGGITITTPGQLNIRDTSQIGASTFGDAGAGGTVSVQADGVTIAGAGARIASLVDFGSPSLGGTIDLNIRTLRLAEGGKIETSTLDPLRLGTTGSAGSIVIRNAQLVEITGETNATGLFAQVGDFETGPVGITGSGGLISLNTELLRLSGSRATISSGTEDAGAGGSIAITAGQVQVQNGAQIQAATAGFAPGGQITVRANTVEVQGIGTSASFGPSALVTSTLGNSPAGDITVTTGRLTVAAGGRLSASSEGAGAGGSIWVTATDQVALAGRSPASASGLFAEGRGSGPAGTIEVRSPLLLLNQGQIVAETISDDGGNVQLRIPQLILLDNQALISASAGRGSGSGNGGNINIDTRFLVAIPGSDSDIVANAFLGQGGNIQITALGILQIEPRPAIAGNGTNDIDASSTFGQNGTVTIAQPDSDPSRGLDAAAPEFVDVSQLVAQGCQGGQSSLAGRLTVTGRGGVALDPGTVPSAGMPFTDLGEGSLAIAPGEATLSSTAPDSQPPSPPVEAQGWMVNDQGEVVLVAQASRGELVASRGALGQGATASCASQF